MMTDDTTKALQAVPLFSDMSDKDLERVVVISKQVHHAEGKVVVEEDRSAVGFHLILKGTAEASTGGTVVSSLAPGAYFGEISLLDGKPRSASVTATSDLTTLAIPSWNFNRLLDEHPEMMRALLIALCDRLRNLRDR
jgi:CRP/FNR family transcriptional regulator, cyclic AMP receptor protein